LDPFYRDGRLYDVMNAELVEDADFFVTEAGICGGPVLEVACGTGRIAIPIARQGIDITGLDISEGMLSEARRKAARAGVKAEWVRADCRNFTLSRKFKLIFIAFNSMQHLHDLNSLELFFANVRSHLAPGGTFIIDVFNPSVAILARDRGQRYHVMDLTDPHSGKSASIDESITYDAATQVNRVKWYFSFADQRDYRVDDLQMRCFYPQELDALVKYNGFSIVKKFGYFDRSEFKSDSPKQILLLRAR